MPPIPYVFNIANQHKEHTAIRNNIGPARAWRAPNHPQAAVITMGALDDLAAKLNMDPLDLWRKNLEIAGPRGDTYREELTIAADLMGWKEKWRPRGQNVSGNIARGLGVSPDYRAEHTNIAGTVLGGISQDLIPLISQPWKVDMSRCRTHATSNITAARGISASGCSLAVLPAVLWL